MYSLGPSKVVLESYQSNARTTIIGRTVGIDVNASSDGETTIFLTIVTKDAIKFMEIIKTKKGKKKNG